MTGANYNLQLVSVKTGTDKQESIMFPTPRKALFVPLLL